jgi:eukaryotic-like serine/threonine-protein kinase
LASCLKCGLVYDETAPHICPADATAEHTGELEVPSGTKVGEYIVESRIGQGAFGTVYRATHPVIGKLAAVKVLSRRYSFDARASSRFISEARAVNQIRHPNIIDIFSFGSMADGRQYHIMEFLDGRTLESLLEERGRLDLEEALAILEPIARALDAAHAKGIAHRDLKPANVFLASVADGHWYPKLLDFGIAKLMSDEIPRGHATSTGAALGTPYYMSPEQCRGVGVDHRTDVYSFGVMTYRMITGRMPFQAATAVDLLFQHLNAPPTPPSTVMPEISQRLSDAIVAMLEKDPAKRPGSVSEAVRALRAAVHGTSDERPRPITMDRPPVPDPASNPSASPTIPALLGTVSGVHGTPDLTSRVEPRDHKARPMIGAFIVLTMLLGTGLLILRGGSDQPPVQATPAISKVVEAVPPPPPPAPKTVQVTFRETPDRTEVRSEDGTLLGHVPGTIEIATSTRSQVLKLSAPGHKAFLQEIVPSQNTVLVVRLEKEAPPAREKPVKPKPQKKQKPADDDLPAYDEQPAEKKR